MSKRMLIDATHEEETRVAVVDGNRLEEFEYESTYRKPLKGSIFLAKVTRVEPSLQAAFVNFGGNRHGFLPFSEIHPDYFRIPIADREALLAEQEALIAEQEKKDAEEAEAEADGENESDNENDNESDDASLEHDGDLDENAQDEDIASEGSDEKPPSKSKGRKAAKVKITEKTQKPAKPKTSKAKKTSKKEDKEENAESEQASQHINEDTTSLNDDDAIGNYQDSEDFDEPNGNLIPDEQEPEDNIGNVKEGASEEQAEGRDNNKSQRGRGRGRRGGRNRNNNNRRRTSYRNRRSETFDDEMTEEQRFRFRLRRKYKIQEVIKRGQIMLIQVSKEERGNKGAAVTSYLSLPGRYCVLMPNSPRAGGVSRKIANYKDRAKMRDILKSLEIPKGMSVIVRTAGVSRTKTEIKRDFDYLMRLWSQTREQTLQSSAPAMIYEEANLVKRAVRDIYTRDIGEIVVAGTEGYKVAKQFMKLLIPSHVKKIQSYDEEKVPLFHRYQIENQISDIGKTSVTLKSGGYLVINPTEALVAIDVNSGKATKERHIEETALKTNLEAAEELARQLRLRDLGGLVVVDFIDMEDRRNNSKVERKLREALSTDRARIQVGRISNFGLLELSRQRLNPSLTEAQFETCPHCNGMGLVRTIDATSVMVIRAIEEEAIKGRASQLIAHVSNSVALYILNNKNRHVADIEDRFNLSISIRIDEKITESDFRIETAKTLKENDGENDGDLQAEEGDQESGDAKDAAKSNNRRRGRRGGRRRNPRARSDDADSENRNNDDLESSEGKQDLEQDFSKEDGDDLGPNGNTKRPRGQGRGRGSGNQDKDRMRAKEKNNEKGQDRSKTNYKKEGKNTEDKRKNLKDEDKKKTSPSSKTQDKKASSKKETAGKKVANDTPVKKVSSTRPAKEDKPEKAAHKEHEVVNEAPKKKKSGWWNRLID